MTERQHPCEACGQRPGILNSEYLFNAPFSAPDCGDWVCAKCEDQARKEAEEETYFAIWYGDKI